MKTRFLLMLIAAMAISCSQPDAPKLTYPVAKKVDQTDEFFGTKVADPYRWLESSDTPDARAWIDAENKVTFDYLAQIPDRAKIKARLTDIWNYERFGAPSREGSWYVFARNTGLQAAGGHLQDQEPHRPARRADRPERVVEGRHGRSGLDVVHAGWPLHGLLRRGQRVRLD